MWERGPQKRMFATALLGLLALASIAGCMGGGGSDNKAENKAPAADLSVDKKTGWTGQTFSFDPRASKDPDGQITEYKISFGDGTEMKYDPRTDADREVDHTYARGGEYTVTLTVTDNGASNAGTLTGTDDVKIAVNEKSTIADQVLYAGDSNQEPAKAVISIPAGHGADKIESQVTIRNSLLVGSSEFEVRLKDTDNNTLETKTMSVAANSNQTQTLRGTVTDEGTYLLEVIAKSGAGMISGENRVYYDVGFTG